MTPVGRKLALGVDDFNRDGVQDLALVNRLSTTVSVLLGKGNRTFQPAAHFGAGIVPHSVVVGSFHGGEVQDLAVADVVAGILVLINNTFARRMSNQRRLGGGI